MNNTHTHVCWLNGMAWTFSRIEFHVYIYMRTNNSRLHQKLCCLTNIFRQ